MKLIGVLVLSLFLLSVSLCPPNQEGTNSNSTEPAQKRSGVTVTYIGNEGVLLTAGDKQVLIDGLHREYKPDYAFPPPALLKSLETAASPYDRVRLILVTHLHLDHFHPLTVGLHLQNNQRAELVSSDQIADGVKKDYQDFQAIETRVRRIPHQWKKKVAVNVTDIPLKCLGLKHSSAHFSWIQNLGYIVELNGKKFLHVGDADVTSENFSSLGLVDEQIDVAFLPYWFLLSETGRTIVEKEIRPKQVIALHVSPAEAASVSQQVRAAYPQAFTFTRILETRSF